ncbi:hypothetical protein BDV25DRAFT_152232 [Aspergillus avenaceus]|uniref:Uncharacterized protein n=1 Tax=Aspergillus avenaceus TaxID=36643 RepID=A0A5N6TZC7_ASPAV|nr:hypothetical protein BDV25DRAFT_152232 [Aspergillus avenaceus]
MVAAVLLPIKSIFRFLWLVLLCPLAVVIATGAVVSVTREGLAPWRVLLSLIALWWLADWCLNSFLLGVE